MNTDTYTEPEHTIKPYKFRRLPPSFWSMWKQSTKGKNVSSVRYSLVTHMTMQRFTKEEIIKMMYSWHHKHGLTISHTALLDIIESVKDFTKDERRRLKRKEMQTYRAKKEAMKDRERELAA